MTCCGNGKHRPSSALAASGRSVTRPVMFEYAGTDPLTIFGRATGIRYHFPGAGARARVDPRDVPILEIVRGLRIVGEVPAAR
jgi:hypothetical protein